jgi:cellulase/cellobiase CelA1
MRRSAGLPDGHGLVSDRPFAAQGAAASVPPAGASWSASQHRTRPSLPARTVGQHRDAVDVARDRQLGWEDNFEPFAQLALEAANANGATPDDVHGFASNVANYGDTAEPYFDIGDTVNGVSIREGSSWVDWNNYVDELSYAQAYRDLLASIGFDDNLGMLIDTSRNG